MYEVIAFSSLLYIILYYYYVISCSPIYLTLCVLCYMSHVILIVLAAEVAYSSCVFKICSLYLKGHTSWHYQNTGNGCKEALIYDSHPMLKVNRIHAQIGTYPSHINSSYLIMFMQLLHSWTLDMVVAFFLWFVLRFTLWSHQAINLQTETKKKISKKMCCDT